LARAGRNNLVTTPERSRRMAAIRQHGTEPELAVRASLSRLGVRYRLNVRSLPGRPDIANGTRKLAVFVHGCFWHRHEGCRKTTTPTRNREFWEAKFDANRARDRRAVEELETAGYRVCVIWECETVEEELLESRLRACLGLSDRKSHPGLQQVKR
jgi:DNA mismatch endonuclease (patch repair protein)